MSDEEALSVPDSDLPFYTILLPAYNEASVIIKLIENLAQMDYPDDRLEVLLLVEQDDEETLSALRAAQPPPQFKLVLIPPAEPRTKPKALNFGLTLARGEIVAVYDVEDKPDVLQLRRAAVTLGRYGPEVGCVQAKAVVPQCDPEHHHQVVHRRVRHVVFVLSPWACDIECTDPAGRDVEPFSSSALRTLGGWDPYNVTEDCDLGIRMFREHYEIKVLESTTFEEANSDFVNWVKQRSRWYKGYLQTFLIHLRSPRELTQEIGVKGVGHLCAFVGGTPILATLNPIFWVMTMVWFIAQPEFLQGDLPCARVLRGADPLGLRELPAVVSDRSHGPAIGPEGLVFAAMLVPIYWVMMSIAALKAAWQLIVTPSFWEKTVHGLDADLEDPEAEIPTPRSPETSAWFRESTPSFAVMDRSDSGEASPPSIVAVMEDVRDSTLSPLKESLRRRRRKPGRRPHRRA